MVDATQQVRQGRSPDSGRHPGSGAPAAFGFVASLGAAAAGSCCALPLALASVGVGGAWLGNLGTLTPYRPYLLGAAMVGLGVAWMTTLRRARRRTCETAPACRRAPARRWTFAVLAASTLLVLFAASSNWLEPLIVDALLDAGGRS